MNWFDFITKISGGLSGIGLIIFVLIAYRIGLLQWIAEMRKNGHANGKIDAQKERMDRLESSLNDIKENHFTHLNKMVSVLETKIDIIMRHLKL